VEVNVGFEVDIRPESGRFKPYCRT